MRRKKNKQDFADLIIHEEIMREGERLEKELGPVTFEESPDFDIEKSFLELQRKIENRDCDEMDAEETVARKKRVRTSEKFRILKFAVVCLVVAICAFTFCMSSEAARVWWMECVERVIGNESSTVLNNSEKRIKTELPEWEAAAEIEEETGIPVPKFMERPAEMQFDSYTYNESMKYAFMYYMVEEEVIILYMQGADKDSTAGIHYGGEVLNKDDVTIPYGTVLIKEIQAKEDEASSQVAEWIYKNCFYRIIGKMDKEAMVSMIENMCY